jgi:hypothetical protein
MNDRSPLAAFTTSSAHGGCCQLLSGQGIAPQKPGYARAPGEVSHEPDYEQPPPAGTEYRCSTQCNQRGDDRNGILPSSSRRKRTMEKQRQSGSVT